MPTAKGPFLLPFLLLASLAARGPAQDPPDRKTPAIDRPGEYVTVDTCTECHEEEAVRIKAGAHHGVPESKDLKGCETCHGPGKAHVDVQDAIKITMPAHLPRAEQEALCARCHRDQMQSHGGDPRGLVLAAKICTDCHQVHRARADEPGSLEKRAFTTRGALSAATKQLGGAACVQCHPRKAHQLTTGGHRKLLPAQDAAGCESCHGHGTLHQSALGIRRLITRPDKAHDGIATCRACHTQVHETEFHWQGRPNPLLTPGLTCTSCHQIHDRKVPDPEPAKATAPASRKISQLSPSQALGLLVLPLAALAQEGAAASRPASQPASSQPKSPAATFIGNEACQKCHAPAFTAAHVPAHESLKGKAVAPGKGCESCHGPGSAHADGPGRKQLIQSLKDAGFAVQKATCTQCHGRERPLAQVCGGAHARHEVGCVQCHTSHGASGTTATRKDAEQRCGSCHPAVVAEFRLPNRHRVLEGVMTCSDCHDAHGARGRILDHRLKKDTCVGCHREYAGPFVFEHQVTRTEGCVACHSPHGSTNRRLLKQANTQQNCIACHADFPSFHDQTRGSVFTNCLNCHTELHGSNVSRFFLR